MKTKIQILFAIAITFFACNKKTINSPQNEFSSNVIFDKHLSTIIENIENQYLIKQVINENDTLFYTLYFYCQNDSDFLDISCDIGPTFFFFGYKNFLGFSEYKSNYIIVVSLAQNSIPQKFICLDILNKNIKEYENLNNEKYLSDGTLFKYKIENGAKLIPNNNLAKYISEIK